VIIVKFDAGGTTGIVSAQSRKFSNSEISLNYVRFVPRSKHSPSRL